MLISGNRAIVYGCLNSGVKYFTGYPGTPCTEIGEWLSEFENINVEWSINEKVALEVATGISYSGNRVLVAMKTLGLNVAADCLSQISGASINGGLVLVVADDVGRIAADDYQDSRYYGTSYSIPILEPANSEEAYYMTSDAFTISEEFCTPVIIRMNSITCKSSTVVENINTVLSDVSHNIKYKKSLQKTIGNIVRFGFKNYSSEPLNEYWVDFEDNKRKLTSYSNKYAFNYHKQCESEVGVIACGNAVNYVEEIRKEIGILKLGMTYPLPNELIKEFCNKYKKIYILEDGLPVIEKEINRLGYYVIGEKCFERFPKMLHLSSEIVEEKILGIKSENDKIPVPFRLPENCLGCPHYTIYSVLKESNVISAGGIGCGSLASFPHNNVVDIVKCMGSSIGIAHGNNKTDNESIISVMGDGEFWHSGLNGLINTYYNNGKGIFIIQDNYTIAMTGGQNCISSRVKNDKKHRRIAIEDIIKAIGIKEVYIVDGYDKKTIKELIKQYYKSDNIVVIISRKECRLFKDI